MPWLLALGLACQGTRPAATPSPPGTHTVTPPASTAPASAGPTGLAGEVWSASDVTGQPDTPLPDQLVLAVPVDRADEVLGAGTASLDERGLRFLKASLPAPHPALAVALTGAAGGFTLSLPPGDYVLCLADSDLSPPGFPARTRGCGRVNVTAGPLVAVEISSGFGEILVATP